MLFLARIFSIFLNKKATGRSNFTSGVVYLCLLQGEKVPFKPFTFRYHVPYKASESTSPLWYSIKRASAYIIVLSSYSAYGEMNN